MRTHPKTLSLTETHTHTGNVNENDAFFNVYLVLRLNSQHRTAIIFINFLIFFISCVTLLHLLLWIVCKSIRTHGVFGFDSFFYNFISIAESYFCCHGFCVLYLRAFFYLAALILLLRTNKHANKTENQINTHHKIRINILCIYIMNYVQFRRIILCFIA